MSIRVMSWVFAESKSTGAQRLVLLVIAEHAKDHGGDAYPSLTRIAERARTNKRTAQRAIQNLVGLGELAVRENAGPGGAHRYRVLVPRGWRDTTPRGLTPPVTDHPERRDTAPTDGVTPPPLASDPAGGGNTPPKPSLNPSSDTSEGNRYGTLRAVPATQPPAESRSRCTRHRNGNPDNENCHGCRMDREHDEQIAERVKRAEAERIRSCPDCAGSGWREEPNTGLPAGKCDHRRAS